MSLNLGYLISTFIFAAVFIALLFFQIRSKFYRPYLYWFTIIASTTVGTTLADLIDRSLGIGYIGGSSLLLGLVCLICAELAGDFHLGYARQLTDKSSLLFDLAF